MRATVNMTVSYGGLQRLAPKPAPAPNKADEYWWIEWCEGMPLQPACISFEGDTPAKVQQLGDDSWGTPLEEVPHIRLVAPVPAYAPGQVVITHEEFTRMWDALRWRDHEAPDYSWLDAVKTRVDAQRSEADEAIAGPRF